MQKISRKQFIKSSLAMLAGLAISEPLLATLKYVDEIDNPLAFYPKRNWEKIYRSQFGHDFSYHFLCAPNDTHNCLLKAFVKNDIITRIGPNYGYGSAVDVYGNQASSRWEPRVCNKGLALNRRVYGPRRVKYPMIRSGFKRWIDDGFPRLVDGTPPKQYLERGKENFVKVSWDDLFQYAAKTMINIASTYSGEHGKKLLRQQGYEPEVIEAMQGAGTQAMKFRGGMPLLGITRVFGMYRFANSLALLDAQLRKVNADKALGARGFDNYTWHTD
ncbi:MAG: molybdopterin oxidoreductase, partial [bacterium]|nr:molybdopterin oxidoreductase [bacterium]